MLLIVAYRVAQRFPQFSTEHWKNVEDKQKKWTDENLSSIFSPYKKKEPENTNTQKSNFNIQEEVKQILASRPHISIGDLSSYFGRTTCIIEQNGECVGRLGYSEIDMCFKIHVQTPYINKSFRLDIDDDAQECIMNAIQALDVASVW